MAEQIPLLPSFVRLPLQMKVNGKDYSFSFNQPMFNEWTKFFLNPKFDSNSTLKCNCEYRDLS